jgi:hypothetical protein
VPAWAITLSSRQDERLAGAQPARSELSLHAAPGCTMKHPERQYSRTGQRVSAPTSPSLKSEGSAPHRSARAHQSSRRKLTAPFHVGATDRASFASILRLRFRFHLRLRFGFRLRFLPPPLPFTDADYVERQSRSTASSNSSHGIFRAARERLLTASILQVSESLCYA